MKRFFMMIGVITILYGMTGTAAARELERSAVVGVSRDAQRGAVVFRTGVLFDKYQTVLPENAKTGLVKVADALIQNDGFKVRVEGYADTSGTPRLNRHLSQERAASVKAFLVERGVRADRLIIRGNSAMRPVGDNATPEGRAVNRRVELIVEETAKTAALIENLTAAVSAVDAMLDVKFEDGVSLSVRERVVEDEVVQDVVDEVDDVSVDDDKVDDVVDVVVTDDVDKADDVDKDIVAEDVITEDITAEDVSTENIATEKDVIEEPAIAEVPASKRRYLFSVRPEYLIVFDEISSAGVSAEAGFLFANGIMLTANISGGANYFGGELHFGYAHNLFGIARNVVGVSGGYHKTNWDVNLEDPDGAALWREEGSQVGFGGVFWKIMPGKSQSRLDITNKVTFGRKTNHVRYDSGSNKVIGEDGNGITWSVGVGYSFVTKGGRK